jgi:hypothetical protein
MDIETKRYRLKMDTFGGATVTHKRTGLTDYVQLSELPSVHKMAMMTEAAFDRLMMIKADL